ncbi:ATP-binding protein [Roseibium sp.]|uniref:YobI family P-loop NTPase n=1 Tax=Roseibium sp. TaxID=1936156 RepID=UPI003A97A376
MNLTILSRFKAWLFSIVKKEKKPQLKYVDLAPTDEADESGIYSGALDYAIKRPNVSNIALTGPYGSGKSSIIKTFLKTYKPPPLQISLASFLPEADGSVTTNNSEARHPQKGAVSKQEIERSILQQMLYGADANSLPLSRFKRIQSPKWWSRFISLFIILGLVACWHLVQKRTEIFSGDFFKPFDLTNWFNLTSFAVGFLFLWQSLHHIYVKSFGVSLKSISLKDIEITPESAEEESILNRHLDEIIYFFQSTKYDLVVIEDLDRFNNPDIFVTLREINSLINANAGVKRPIRFLYALRDNMFVNTDRTKFFEFIIPVIPIINSSNSIDKVIEQGKRLSLDKRLDPQFLREVSRYLNDMRLIQNIFNEYAIYIANLETDDENILNPNKLLAILIYKNVLPSDFEELHREKGKLAEILNRHDEYIAKTEFRYKAQISELEQKISDSEKQVPSNLEELRKIYAMAFIAKIPEGHTHIKFNGNQNIPLPSLTGYQDFEQLIEAKDITIFSPQQGWRQFNLGDLQIEVDPEKTYQERKEEIEHKSEDFKNTASKTIRELRTEIAALRTRKFSEVIRTNAKDAEKLFDAFGENKELVKFLVFEGFLDDTYYQFTSLFHSGRLSPNDNKFLIQIRSFNNPEPNFQIDNPKEVIVAMREDDFRQEFVLNKALVDCMFDNQGDYGPQIAKLISFISSNFEKCDAFFSAYYDAGKRIAELTSALIEKWPGFVSVAISAPDNVMHVAQMIARLPEKHLESLHQKDSRVSEFISRNLSEILALGIDFEPDRLKRLQFETKDLRSMGPYPAIARLLTEEGLYVISIENFEFIFREVLGSTAISDLQTKHYSTVLSTQNSALINKIQDDFDRYLKGVLLQSETNTEEDVSTIIKVINHDEIESEDLEQFIDMQSKKLPSIEQIPARLHSPLFRMQKIEASWENCLAYLASENYDAKTLTSFLQQDDTLSTLSPMTVDGRDQAKPLRLFLLNNNDFDADTYRIYIRTLPRPFTQFPTEIGKEKLRILIEEEKISFSNASFSFLGEYEDLKVLFFAKNIDVYFKDSDQYAIDDDFREELLDSDIRDDQKLKIISEMDLTLISSLPSRASVVGQILYRTDADVSSLTADAAQAVIINSNPIAAQITLFNKCQKGLSAEQIWSTIQRLPKPFSKIQKGYGQPTIPNTHENLEFVRWLEKRSIISSSKQTIFGEIRIYNRRR